MAVGLLSGDALETATVVGELRLPRVGYDDEYRPLAGSYGGAFREVAGALREVSLQAGPRSHLFQQVNLFFIYHF